METALQLTLQEREYLHRLLERRHTELLHELHHAVTHAYKDGIKHELELSEQLKSKLGTA